MSNSEINLKQYWFMLRRHSLPMVAVFGAVIGFTLLHTSWQKPVYKALGKLELSNNKTFTLTGFTDALLAQLSASIDRSSLLDTAAEEIRSEPIVLNTIATLNLQEQQGNPLEIKEFLNNLAVTNISQTNILEVAYESTSPEEAAAVVNQVMNFYVSSNVTKNRAEATAARKFLERRLPDLESNVLGAQKALRRFEETNKVADLAEQAKSAVEIVAELDKQITQTQSELAQVNAKLKARQREGRDMVSSARTSRTEQQFWQLESLGLTSKLSTLLRQRTVYQQRFNVIPRLKDEQRRLAQNLKVQASSYEKLLQQLQEARLTENKNLGNATIIQKARIPNTPFVARKLRIFALGVLIGIILAINTALFLEALDTSIKTVRELRKIFSYPILGIIPYFKSSQQIDNPLTEQQIPEVTVRDLPRSPTSEAYRMLQASLQLLNVDKQPKVIVVTSAVPQEGKSTVCANLATAIAQLGQRVLLIDADMRYPCQHYIWHVSNAVGFSNTLVEQVSIKEAIHSRMINLDILTAGILPPNPLALLSSNKIGQLLKEVSTLYDYVILDTPALFLAADALVLGKMADGVLIVARPGVVDSTGAIAAKDRLTQSSQNILGLAINGITTNNKPDNYFYYYAEGY